jgi:hypothetical protein
VLTGAWTQCYRMESRVGEISMYTRPPVWVCSFSNHSKMAISCLKMVTVCSYEVVCVRVCVCVCVCPHTKPLAITPQKSVMPTVTTIITSNLTIALLSCLLTSQCVSSAHSICTPYSTQRMNATCSLSYAFRSSRMWHVSSHRWCWLLKASTNTRALPSVDMSRTTCPVTQHHSQDSLNPQNAVRTSHPDNFISLSYVTFMCLRNFKCDRLTNILEELQLP